MHQFMGLIGLVLILFLTLLFLEELVLTELLRSINQVNEFIKKLSSICLYLPSKCLISVVFQIYCSSKTVLDLLESSTHL